MTESIHPHGVWIRVPLLGLTQRYDLEEAAADIGVFDILNRSDDLNQWVRFGFTDEVEAERFRETAAQIVEDLVASGEPPPHA
jgi:hypothetical protein